MIDVKIVRKHGLSEQEMKNILKYRTSDSPDVFLFPEYALRRKFTEKGLMHLSEELPLGEQACALFSAYCLKERGEDEMTTYFARCNIEDTESNRHMVLGFFLPLYKNTGVVVSGSNNENAVTTYPKKISTSLDAMNVDSEEKNMIIRRRSSSYIDTGIAYDDDADFSREKVSFPLIDMDGKRIEFRVCADIECGTLNDSDMVMVSAHNLFDVGRKLGKSPAESR